MDIHSGGVVIEECYHIGNFTVKDTQKSALGIAGGGTHQNTIRNCYSVGEITNSRTPAGITGGSIWVDTFNCYSIGKISSNYCGGIINGMNYGGHIVHCFGRQGDFSTLSSYNNTNGYGHSSNAKINYECGILTDDELKAQSFVDELNILIEADSEGNITETEQNVWKMDTEGINNGYPIFVWQ